MSPDDFVQMYPTLWHMAELDNWPLIEEYGLLSTTALLDLFEYSGSARQAIESAFRANSIQIDHPGVGVATIRDQRPMVSDAVVSKFLDVLSPAKWYKLLNSRVFFWVAEPRLERMLAAGLYRERPHKVLELDTAQLLDRHLLEVTLSPINSGAIFPMGTTRRGPQTFKRFDEYPWRDRLGRAEPVVELAVDRSLPDVMELLRDVSVRKAPQKKKS